jgi:hypothetical protein
MDFFGQWECSILQEGRWFTWQAGLQLSLERCFLVSERLTEDVNL